MERLRAAADASRFLSFEAICLYARVASQMPARGARADAPPVPEGGRRTWTAGSAESSRRSTRRGILDADARDRHLRPRREPRRGRADRARVRARRATDPRAVRVGRSRGRSRRIGSSAWHALPAQIAEACGLEEHPWRDDALPSGSPSRNTIRSGAGDDPRVREFARRWGLDERRVGRLTRRSPRPPTGGYKLVQSAMARSRSTTSSAIRTSARRSARARPMRGPRRAALGRCGARRWAAGDPPSRPGAAPAPTPEELAALGAADEAARLHVARLQSRLCRTRWCQLSCPRATGPPGWLDCSRACGRRRSASSTSRSSSSTTAPARRRAGCCMRGCRGPGCSYASCGTPPRWGRRRRATRAGGLARGELVAFTDDDCTPAPIWLARGGRRRVATAPGAIVQGGRRPDPREPVATGRPLAYRAGRLARSPVRDLQHLLPARAARRGSAGSTSASERGPRPRTRISRGGRSARRRRGVRARRGRVPRGRAADGASGARARRPAGAPRCASTATTQGPARCCIAGSSGTSGTTCCGGRCSRCCSRVAAHGDRHAAPDRAAQARPNGRGRRRRPSRSCSLFDTVECWAIARGAIRHRTLVL